MKLLALLLIPIALSGCMTAQTREDQAAKRAEIAATSAEIEAKIKAGASEAEIDVLRSELQSEIDELKVLVQKGQAEGYEQFKLIAEKAKSGDWPGLLSIIATNIVTALGGYGTARYQVARKTRKAAKAIAKPAGSMPTPQATTTSAS